MKWSFAKVSAASVAALAGTSTLRHGASRYRPTRSSHWCSSRSGRSVRLHAGLLAGPSHPKIELYG